MTYFEKLVEDHGINEACSIAFGECPADCFPDMPVKDCGEGIFVDCDECWTAEMPECGAKAAECAKEHTQEGVDALEDAFGKSNKRGEKQEGAKDVEIRRLSTIAKRSEEKLQELMPGEEFHKFMTSVARETFRMEISGMADGAFKDFCLKNLDGIMVGGK